MNSCSVTVLIVFQSFSNKAFFIILKLLLESTCLILCKYEVCDNLCPSDDDITLGDSSNTTTKCPISFNLLLNFKGFEDILFQDT